MASQNVSETVQFLHNLLFYTALAPSSFPEKCSRCITRKNFNIVGLFFAMCYFILKLYSWETSPMNSLYSTIIWWNIFLSLVLQFVAVFIFLQRSHTFAKILSAITAFDEQIKIHFSYQIDYRYDCLKFKLLSFLIFVRVFVVNWVDFWINDVVPDKLLSVSGWDNIGSYMVYMFPCYLSDLMFLAQSIYFWILRDRIYILANLLSPLDGEIQLEKLRLISHLYHQLFTSLEELLDFFSFFMAISVILVFSYCVEYCFGVLLTEEVVINIIWFAYLTIFVLYHLNQRKYLSQLLINYRDNLYRIAHVTQDLRILEEIKMMILQYEHYKVENSVYNLFDANVFFLSKFFFIICNYSIILYQWALIQENERK